MAVAKERERGIERDDCCGGSIKCKFVLKRPIFPENIVGPSLVARLSLSRCKVTQPCRHPFQQRATEVTFPEPSSTQFFFLYVKKRVLCEV